MNKIPFVYMLYEQNGERKIFKCNFENEFKQEFAEINENEIKVGFFFVMGQDYKKVKTLKDAFQFWKD